MPLKTANQGARAPKTMRLTDNASGEVILRLRLLIKLNQIQMKLKIEDKL